ncbi:insertion sequence 2 OrfA protein [Shigella boydii]|nr:insertion sequence 2 OrfA protein [Shigella boydii]
MIDVLGPEKRRRRTTQEKIAIVQQSFEPGMTVSLVARQHGVAASQLFLWLKWSTKTGHRVRVFPVSIFRFVWGEPTVIFVRS